MMRSWIVRTPDHSTTPTYYEPPEFGCDVCVVHAATKRQATIDGARQLKAEGSRWVRDNAGYAPPWSGLIVEVADCRHGYLLGTDWRTDCPWCALEDGYSQAAETAEELALSSRNGV